MRDTAIIMSYPIGTLNKPFQGLFCIWLVSDLYKLNTHRIGVIFRFHQARHGFCDNTSGVISYTVKRR